MIITTTSVRCDHCQRLEPFLTEDNDTRRQTAASLARSRGWARRWVGDEIKDFCPDCKEKAPQC